jgi:ubiquinone biosynthesis protein
VKAIAKLFLARPARQSLLVRVEPADADRILADAWREYDALEADLPREPTIGARLLLQSAAFAIALHRALVDAGEHENEATQRVADAMWASFQTSNLPGDLIANVSTRDPLTRARRANAVFEKLFLSPPAYQFEEVLAAPDEVAKDVVRCPLADYFRAQGMEDLCTAAFCDLDFLMADKWGVALTRTGTLAQGSDRCDFRWRSA